MATNEMEDLDALIVRNLDKLEVATHRLYYEVEPRICKVINEVTERWAKQNKWVGEFDWWDEELWIAPVDWRRSADEWLCRFFLDGGAGDEWRDVSEEDSFWLTRLCQKGGRPWVSLVVQ